MKTLFPALLMLIGFRSAAQHVLPFTGLVYESHGISGEMEVRLAEDTWTSNRLPSETEFEIKLIKPYGFEESDGVVRPGIAVQILSAKGDTLGSSPNILSEDFEGFSASELTHLSVTLTFGPEAKPGDSVLVKAQFFDQLSKRYLEAQMQMVVVDGSLPLETTTSTWSVFGSSGYDGIATEIELNDARIDLTEATGFNKPKKDIYLDSLVNLTPSEFEKGKFTVWEYTSGKAKQVRDVDYYTFVKATSDPNAINLRVSIPMGATTYYRFRWESPDRKKVLDFVSE